MGIVRDSRKILGLSYRAHHTVIFDFQDSETVDQVLTKKYKAQNSSAQIFGEANPPTAHFIYTYQPVKTAVSREIPG